MLEKLRNLRLALFRVDSRTVYLYSLITGLLTGAVAILFHATIHGVATFAFDGLANTSLEDAPSIFVGPTTGDAAPRYLIILLLPALGGLLVGLCTRYWAPEAAGTGVDHLLEAFHTRSGSVRKRTSFAKFLASTATIATGGSAGKEGPMAMIGAGIGSLFGKFIKMGARAKRTLLLAGAAGGLGAIFRAPLGGAITAVEVLYKEDFETDSLIPCIISSVTAYTLFSSILGFSHNLRFETTIFHSPLELVFYVFLGLFCSWAGFIFIRVFGGLRERVFEPIKIHPVLKPALGGLIIGVCGVIFPQAIGEGMGVIQSVIDGQYSAHWLTACLFLLALGLLKMMTTSITIQSGGSGGVLIPSLFIGATLGGFLGNIFHHFFPTLVPEVTPFIVVGMAAFFSGVTNASLGALVMVTELTGGYELLPPLMIVAVISLIMSHKRSIYRNQVRNKFLSQAHLWDMNPMNLQHVKISNAFGSNYGTEAIIPSHLSLDEIEKLTHQTQTTDYIIQNDKNELVGVLSMRDVSELEELGETKGILIAEDLISRKTFYLSENESLYEALKFLLDSDFDKLPIVREEDGKRHLLGYLRHKDILSYYYKMGLQKGA